MSFSAPRDGFSSASADAVTTWVWVAAAGVVLLALAAVQVLGVAGSLPAAALLSHELALHYGVDLDAAFTAAADDPTEVPPCDGLPAVAADAVVFLICDGPNSLAVGVPAPDGPADVGRRLRGGVCGLDGHRLRRLSTRRQHEHTAAR
jgi:hypothetical protein